MKTSFILLLTKNLSAVLQALRQFKSPNIDDQKNLAGGYVTLAIYVISNANIWNVAFWRLGFSLQSMLRRNIIATITIAYSLGLIGIRPKFCV